MSIDSKDKIICEFRYDKFIRKIIFGTFKNLLKIKFKNEDIQYLYDILENGIELIELLIGESDIKLSDRIFGSKLEDLMDSPVMYKAIKSLTKNQKSAIFLCEICDLSYEKVAKKMGYKTTSSVYKLVESAKKKIKEILDGGNCDD